MGDNLHRSERGMDPSTDPWGTLRSLVIQGDLNVLPEVSV